MRGKTVLDLLEGSKSFVGMIPVVGSQLSSLVELGVKIYQIVEGIESNNDLYTDLRDRVGMLIVAIGIEYSRDEYHSKLDSGLEMRLKVLHDVLQSVAKAVQTHLQRDVTEYPGFLASAKKSWRGVQYRNHDKEEVEGLKKLVDGFVEQFQVSTLIENSHALESLSADTKKNYVLQLKMRNDSDSALLKRELGSVEKTQWNEADDLAYCLSGTRVKLLELLHYWATDTTGPRVLWVSGLAGTGKSTLARSFCQEIHRHCPIGGAKTLASSFFISHQVEKHRDAWSIVHGLAYGLATIDPLIRSSTALILNEWPNLTKAPLSDQVNHLIAGPLSKASPSGEPLVLVIDALDECDMDQRDGEARKLIALLLDTIKQSVPVVKLLVTSRPEPDIRGMFLALKQECKSVDLHDSNSQALNVKPDIRHYLEHSLKEVATQKSISPPWPTIHDFDTLTARAGDLFVFASTVIKFIKNPLEDPVIQLQNILRPIKNTSLYEVSYENLDTLYGTILVNSLKTDGRQDNNICRRFRLFAGSIVVMFDPLSAKALSLLLGVNFLQLDGMIKRLHAVFLAPDDQPIQVLHPSFPEYLLTQSRCSGLHFHINSGKQHIQLALSCLNVMNSMHNGLQRDICKIRNISLLNSDIEDLQTRIDTHIPPELQYACRHWIAHLGSAVGASVSFEEHKAMHDQLVIFCNKHLAHWLEVTSLLGALHSSFAGYSNISKWLKSAGMDGRVSSVLSDATRVVGQFGTALEASALQAYNSVELFMPLCPLYDQITSQSEAYVRLVSQRSNDFANRTLRTMGGHDGPVQSVTFSQDGIRIVSGSEDDTMRIWDANTGALLSEMRGHEGGVNSVVFSPDGMHIASGSYDKTVRVWDANAGTLLETLQGHEGWVISVKFSPDGTRIASGSDDRTVRLWDATTGTLLEVLQGHKSGVLSVAFSPDGTRIATGSLDKTLHVWDATTGALLETLQGHKSFVYSVAFSPDGTRIASGSFDHTVRVWDATTGTLLETLKGHNGGVSCVAFSPDGTRIASGSYDEDVRTWDATTGALLDILEGHNGEVNSIAFSPDGSCITSGSSDRTVRVWDVITDALLETLQGHGDGVTCIVFSPDGTGIASGSDDNTVRVWDATTGAVLATLQGHEDRVYSVAFSPDGTRIASGSFDKAVRVWDATTGTLLETLQGHEGTVNSVVFSPDGTRIASGSNDQTVRVWEAITGARLETLEGHEVGVSSVVFSPDGTRIAAGSYDRNVRVWDLTTGTLLETLQGHNGGVNSVAFSPNGTYIASGSHDKIVRMWHATTGALLATLLGHTGSVSSVAFSRDGTQIISRDVKMVTRTWDVRKYRSTPIAPSMDAMPSELGFPTFSIQSGWLFAQIATDAAPRRLCWIPKDRRPGTDNSMSWHGSTVVLGSKTGIVTILDCSAALPEMDVVVAGEHCRGHQ